MEKREFHSRDELEQVKGELATASQCPVYVDIQEEYQPFAGEGEVIEPRHIDNRTLSELRNRNAIWNQRDNEMVYFGSDQYKLVQHSTVLDAVEKAMERTVGDIDMGVIRDYGSQVDGTLVFSGTDEAIINVEDIVDMDGYIPPESQVDPRGGSRARDTLGLGMRLGNSFDGKKRIYFSTMGYRFICQNWMVWGEENIAQTEAFHIEDLTDDRDNIDQLVELVEEVIGEVFEIRDDVIGIVKDSESEEIPLEWVPGLLEEAGFGPNYQKRITGRVLRQYTPRDEYTTSWRLYNAATSELDNRKVSDIQLQSYNRYQKASWDLLGEPSAPSWEIPIEEMELEFAIR